MVWRPKGQVVTQTDNSVSPRLSLIVAIGSDGKLHYSLTQVNTDHRVFCLFITELVKKLNKEDPSWKDNTIVVIDGASYHTHDDTKELFKQLGVTLAITAPYSYSTSPAELVFARFKQGEINDSLTKTGKR